MHSSCKSTPCVFDFLGSADGIEQTPVHGAGGRTGWIGLNVCAALDAFLSITQITHIIDITI